MRCVCAGTKCLRRFCVASDCDRRQLANLKLPHNTHDFLRGKERLNDFVWRLKNQVICQKVYKAELIASGRLIQRPREKLIGEANCLACYANAH